MAEQPLLGQRFRFPAGFPLKDALVHLAIPIYDYKEWGNHETRVFSGMYGCCRGVLRNYAWVEWNKADWKDWIVTDALTCLFCLVQLP